MAHRESSEAALIGFVYLFSATVCSTISAFSTYTGFRIFPAIVAALISCLIFVLLMACDVSILRARRNGGRIIRPPRTLLGPVLMLVIVTIVSVSSSFTFFYSLTMRDRLAATRAAVAGDNFEKNYDLALRSLQSISSASSKESKIDLELTKLDTQVLHSGRLGFGKEARAIVNDIDSLLQNLGAPMTPIFFPDPPGTPATNANALQNFRAAVFQNLAAAKNGDGVSPSIAKIVAIRNTIEPTVRAVQDESNCSNFRKCVRSISVIAQATNDVERETNEVLAQANRPQIIIKPDGIGGIRLYTAPEVYAVAFKNKEGIPYAYGSLVFAVILDILPLLIALLLIHPSIDGSAAPRRSFDRRAAPDLPISSSKRFG